jgi:NDP-sugar pyrophosphorylase family protein
LKALILAGGGGTRLGSLGEALPKCLLPVFDQLLLLRQIEQCARAGAEDVFVSIAARFEPLISVVLARFQSSVRVTCLPEAIPLGPIGGLLAALDPLGDCRVLMVLGDEYIQDRNALRNVAQAPLSSPDDLALAVVTGSHPSQILCNAVLDGQGRVERLREKPAPHEIVGDARWCGVAAFPARLLKAALPVGPRAGGHIGDALNLLIDRGCTALAIRVPEIHLNLNTLDDALAAAIIESCASERETTIEQVNARCGDLVRRAFPHACADRLGNA